MRLVVGGEEAVGVGVGAQEWGREALVPVVVVLVVVVVVEEGEE